MATTLVSTALHAAVVLSFTAIGGSITDAFAHLAPSPGDMLVVENGEAVRSFDLKIAHQTSNFKRNF